MFNYYCLYNRPKQKRYSFKWIVLGVFIFSVITSKLLFAGYREEALVALIQTKALLNSYIEEGFELPAREILSLIETAEVEGVTQLPFVWGYRVCDKKAAFKQNMNIRWAANYSSSEFEHKNGKILEKKNFFLEVSAQKYIHNRSSFLLVEVLLPNEIRLFGVRDNQFKVTLLRESYGWNGLAVSVKPSHALFEIVLNGEVLKMGERHFRFPPDSLGEGYLPKIWENYTQGLFETWTFHN